MEAKVNEFRNFVRTRRKEQYRNATLPFAGGQQGKHERIRHPVCDTDTDIDIDTGTGTGTDTDTDTDADADTGTGR